MDRGIVIVQRVTRIPEWDQRPFSFRPSDPADWGTLRDVIERPYHMPPAMLRPSFILDLGCHIGATLIDYKHHFPDAEIVGVELVPANAALAMRNVRGIAGVQVHNAAVWSVSGELVSFSCPSSSAAHIIDYGDGRVPTATVDDLVRDRVDVIDFVKMDIEGAEEVVLDNAALWPGRTRCINVEFHDVDFVPFVARFAERFGFHWTPHQTHPLGVLLWNHDL